jgi:hypothetical protein
MTSIGSIARIVCASSIVVGLAALSGCGEKRPEREYRTIAGTAKSIDEATGKVAMIYHNKKKQLDIPVEGTITPNTEILINGRVAQLGEIKIGEQVVVTGYVERQGDDKRIIATKIEVERPEWTRGPNAASQSASKSASKPTTP